MPKGTDKPEVKRQLRPGQVEIHYFDLAQVKAIASPTRAAAYWAFNPYLPLSAADVATIVGKSPQSLHHHVQVLHEVGLLLLAGTRQKRSRTERLYVTIAPISRGLIDAGPEYNRYRVRAFKLETQKMVREYSFSRGLMEVDPSISPYSQYRRYNLHLPPEKALKLLLDLSNVLVEANKTEDLSDPNTIMLNAMVYVMPTVSQLRDWADAAGLNFADLDRSHLTEEVD